MTENTQGLRLNPINGGEACISVLTCLRYPVAEVRRNTVFMLHGVCCTQTNYGNECTRSTGEENQEAALTLGAKCDCTSKSPQETTVPERGKIG